MRFDINNYKGNYAMHCKTEAEAKEFCDYLNSIGKTWQNGASYAVITNWDDDAESACYNFNHGSCASIGFYRRHNYTILEWSDFTTEFTKADLQNGMIVEYANGWKRMVLNGNLLNITNGRMSLMSICDDLTSVYQSSLNINKAYICNTDALTGLSDVFDEHNLTLIWERKEEPKPVEMTLEEVCKALGKEIKIVKG